MREVVEEYAGAIVIFLMFNIFVWSMFWMLQQIWGGGFPA